MTESFATSYLNAINSVYKFDGMPEWVYIHDKFAKGNKIVIGLVDTLIEPRKYLYKKLIGEYDCTLDVQPTLIPQIYSNSGWESDSGVPLEHGSMMATILCADKIEKLDFIGVAPQAKIIHFYVGEDAENVYISHITKALETAYFHNMICAKEDKINILVIPYSENPRITDQYRYMNNAKQNLGKEQKDYNGFVKMKQLIEALFLNNVFIVVAAGNHFNKTNQEGLTAPAIFSTCIAVGAGKAIEVDKKNMFYQLHNTSQYLNKCFELCKYPFYIASKVPTKEDTKIAFDTIYNNNQIKMQVDEYLQLPMSTSTASIIFSGFLCLLYQFLNDNHITLTHEVLLKIIEGSELYEDNTLRKKFNFKILEMIKTFSNIKP